MKLICQCVLCLILSTYSSSRHFPGQDNMNLSCSQNYPLQKIIQISALTSPICSYRYYMHLVFKIEFHCVLLSFLLKFRTFHQELCHTLTTCHIIFNFLRNIIPLTHTLFAFLLIIDKPCTVAHLLFLQILTFKSLL